MSFYELDRPAPSFIDRIKATLASVAAWYASIFETFNESRLIAVMHEMDDETLGKIGITRSQIPAYARHCIAKSQ